MAAQFHPSSTGAPHAPSDDAHMLDPATEVAPAAGIASTTTDRPYAGIQAETRAEPKLPAPSPPKYQGAGVSASLNGIYTLWRRDLLRYIRDYTRIIASLAQPILFLFVFGTGLSQSLGRLAGGGGGSASGGLSYVEFMFPGIIAMGVLFTSFSSAISVVWDREFGFLKEVLVAPMPRWAVVSGKALGGSTTALIQGVVLLIFAPLVGVALTPLTVALLVPAMLLTAIALSALGLLIAALLKTMESFQMVMNFLLMPLFFLSGALFPLGGLPSWLTVLTRIDPVSYGVDAIRRIVLSQAGVPAPVVNGLGVSLFGHPLTVAIDLAIMTSFAAVMMACAVVAFQRQD